MNSSFLNSFCSVTLFVYFSHFSRLVALRAQIPDLNGPERPDGLDIADILIIVISWARTRFCAVNRYSTYATGDVPCQKVNAVRRSTKCRLEKTDQKLPRHLTKSEVSWPSRFLEILKTRMH